MRLMDCDSHQKYSTNILSQSLSQTFFTAPRPLIGQDRQRKSCDWLIMTPETQTWSDWHAAGDSDSWNTCFQRHGAGTGERREREHAGAGGEIVKYYNHRIAFLWPWVERLAPGAGPDSIIKQTPSIWDHAWCLIRVHMSYFCSLITCFIPLFQAGKVHQAERHEANKM